MTTGGTPASESRHKLEEATDELAKGSEAQPSTQLDNGTPPSAHRDVRRPWPPEFDATAVRTQHGSPSNPDQDDLIPPYRQATAPAISPRMTALFGALFGLATVASIFALLIQVFPAPPRSARTLTPISTSETKPETTAAPKAPPLVARQRSRTILPGPWRLSAMKDSHRIVTGTMKRRPFIQVLKEAGVPTAQIYRVLKSMDSVYKFDRPKKNDKFSVAMARNTKKIAAFEYEVSPLEIYQARTDSNGLLKGERLDMKVGTEELSAAFYIGKDFHKSYRRIGLEDGLSRVINKAFNGRTSTEAFHEGGVVRIILVELTALGRFVRYKRLQALEYRPADPSKKPIRAYYFEGDNIEGYVDGSGRRPSNRGWRSPVPGAPLTSHFNPKRMHPVLKRVMPHNGTDFGAPSGTPVYAAYRGTIVFVGRHGPSGNLVTIEHRAGIQTGYAHLLRFAKGLKRGMKIGTRQLIGYVGSTGRSTGPHLHFSAKRNGKFFNPLELDLDALQVLPVSERAAFRTQQRALDARLEAIPLPEPPAEPEPPPLAASPPERAETQHNTPTEASRPTPEPPPASKAAPATAPDDGDELLGADLSGELE